MARGAISKATRKEARKEARAKEAERILSGENENDFDIVHTSEEDTANNTNTAKDDDDDSSSSEEEVDVGTASSSPEETPEKSKTKKSKSARAKKAAMQRTKQRSESGEDTCCGGGPAARGGGEQGIKTLPLVILILLTGTTVLPAILYGSDYIGAFIQKNHVFGNLGHRLGIGSSPKKRVMSFYEKHDPDKLDEIPTILGKYYGDYPKLIKRLERKYGDYGYFINWEKDEAPMHQALEGLTLTKDTLVANFDRHAPAFVKTRVRNVKHNFGFLYKKANKVWKKTIWPVLEPHLGVPDEKAARAQKLKDKKDAANMKKKATGQRRKSAEFRDDDED